MAKKQEDRLKTIEAGMSQSVEEEVVMRIGWELI